MFKEMTDEELLDFCENNFCEYKICQVLGCKDNCKEEDCPLCQLFDRFKKNAVIVPDTNVGHKSEWISVEERLPEESACYLVNIVDHFGLDFVTFTHYTKRYGWGVPDVTHWMPLPEPPMMKGGAE